MVLAVEAVQWHYVGVEAFVDSFARHLASEGHTRITVKVYKSSIHRFFAFVTSRGYSANVESINGADVDSFISDVTRPGVQEPLTADTRA
jgi:site-specific recombinase XerC